MESRIEPSRESRCRFVERCILSAWWEKNGCRPQIPHTLHVINFKCFTIERNLSKPLRFAISILQAVLGFGDVDASTANHTAN